MKSNITLFENFGQRDIRCFKVLFYIYVEKQIQLVMSELDNPVPATYHLKVWSHKYNRYLEYNIKCEVVNESKTQYRIKILEFTHDRKPGEYLWVRKHNVTFIKPEPEEFEEPWWNKI